MKSSSKNLKKSNKKIVFKFKSQYQVENERSKSIEQNPTYLENIKSNISKPSTQNISSNDQKLNNFYVISTNPSTEIKKTNKQNSNKKNENNNPEIGVEGFNQSHPTNRNK